MDNLVKKIAIIPARGGSKRIPNKNIISFKGKAMIGWTIEAALSSKLFDRVIVSTDSERIKKVALEFGAEVPFLRENTADDMSPVSLATLEALNQAEKHYNEKFEEIIQLMPNCPIRNSSNIIDQYDFFKSSDNRESVISAVSYGMFNPHWAHIVKEDSSCERLFNDVFNKRSQDLSKLLCPSGAIWISTRENLMKSQTFYSVNYKLFEMSWINAVDIDDFEDLKLAEIAYNYGKV